MTAYNTISLFSGAMGLDLGIEKAGFKIRVCVEKDKWAAQTIRATSTRFWLLPALAGKT